MRSRLVRPVLFAGFLLAEVPAFAQSSVTLYGIVDDALAYVSNQKGHSNLYLRQGNNAGSRWGFQGSEDLGGGLKAIFTLENGFDPNSGAVSQPSTLFGRQAFVGLTSVNAGSVTLGRQYPATFIQLLRQTPTYWYSGTAGAAPGGIDGLDSTERINNSVVYTSPNLGGLQLSLQYGFGGAPGRTGAGNTVVAAANYSRGPVAIGSGYVRMANTGNVHGGFDSTASGNFLSSPVNQGYLSAHVVQQFVNAATYTIGKLTVGANYANVLYRPDGQSIFHDTAAFNIYGVLAAYQITSAFSTAGGISLTYASKANGISDPARYYQYTLKENYALSKRTSLYALEAFQRTSGNTLGSNGAGNIVHALPSIGDSQSTTPSYSSTQFMAIVGITTSF